MHVLAPDTPVFCQHRRTDVFAAALKLVVEAGNFQQFHPCQPQIGEQAVGGAIVCPLRKRQPGISYQCFQVNFLFFAKGNAKHGFLNGVEITVVVALLPLPPPQPSPAAGFVLRGREL